MAELKLRPTYTATDGGAKAPPYVRVRSAQLQLRVFACALCQSHPCAFRTASMVESTSFHVFGCVMIAFENMHPSQQMC